MAAGYIEFLSPMTSFHDVNGSSSFFILLFIINIEQNINEAIENEAVFSVCRKVK